MSSENLINKLRDNFVGAVEVLKKCKIVDTYLTWDSAVNLTFMILPIPSEETISEIKSSIYSKMKHFIEIDRINDVKLGIVSAMNEDLLSSFTADKSLVCTVFGVDSEIINEMCKSDYRGIDDWIEPLESNATHLDSFYLGRMLGNAASITIAIKQGIAGIEIMAEGVTIGIGGTALTEGFGDPVAITAGVGVVASGLAVEGHVLDAGTLAFSNFGDNYKSYVKASSEGGAGSDYISSKIDDKTLKTLKKYNLDKKYQQALKNGYAQRRQGTNGIIKLSENEIITKSGKTYTHKLKVTKAGDHMRVYGYISEDGELIFDCIMKGK